MTEAQLRRLLRDRVLERGLPWLQGVLDAAGVTRVTALSREQLLAAVEGRDA
jgi:hypothetical protein